MGPQHLTFQIGERMQNGSASFQHTGVRDQLHERHTYTQTHKQDKGQIFGAGLQLFTSGASAKAAPYGDQRHPHTVKCQGQRRAREPEPKCRGEDKTCFMVAVNLGVARWKCQGSTSTLSVSTHILRRSLGEHAHAQQSWHSSAIHLWCSISSATH